MFAVRQRIIAGVCIFIALAIVDLWRNGRAARRWREYLFLFSATLLAMAYGALNDQFSSAISWEYFYYAKELFNVLGPQTPPDRAALRWQAAIVGMKATWSVGLLLGAGLLIANNPRPDRPSIPLTRLMLVFVFIFIGTAITAVIGAIIGWNGGLTWCDEEFRQMVATDMWRPQHFMACWGEHLGAYVGGMAGGVIAVVWVARRKSVPLAQPLNGGENGAVPIDGRL